MLYHNLIEYFGLQFIIKCSFFFHLLGNDAYKSHEKILHRQFLWIYDWWAGDAIWTNLFKQNTKQKPKEQEKSTIFKNNKTTAFGKTRAQFHCVWWFLKFVFIFSLTPDHSQMLPYKFLHILLLLFFFIITGLFILTASVESIFISVSSGLFSSHSFDHCLN